MLSVICNNTNSYAINIDVFHENLYQFQNTKECTLQN
jgi:hypothetical protein